MLTLHRGNRFETLAERSLELIEAGAGDPLAPVTVVVDAPAVGRWLALERALRAGISANLRVMLPGELAWWVAREVLGDVAAPSHTPEVMSWHLADLLAAPPPALAAEPDLARWLDARDERDRDRLARRLATVFDRYLIERPDWLRDWERGEEDHWQAALWRALTARAGGGHWAAVQPRLIRALVDAPGPATLPDPLVVLIAGVLSPAYLEVLAAFSARREVHLLVLDPSREFWGDLVSERTRARLAREGEADALHLDVGNPLLSSLGAERRDFLDRAIEAAGDDREHHREAGGAGALEVLQDDLLGLLGPGEMPRLALAADDDSIQIHACHGRVREVEVLRDALLARFEADPDLDPGEVLVAAPSLDPYRGIIEAVFGDRELPIPVRLARPAAGEVGDALLAMLDVAAGRFDRAEVLDLLARPCVHERFGIAVADLAALEAALAESGVRWGRDASHRRSLALPEDDEHSWRFGLDRLLMGYAVESDEELVAGVAPLAGMLTPDLLAGIADFLAALGDFAARAGRARPVRAWIDDLHALLARVVAVEDPRFAESGARLAANLERLATDADAGRHRIPVGLAVIRDRLAAALDDGGGDAPALAGAVNCCSLAGARGLPFAVVCVLGLDDGEFPRREHDGGLDRRSTAPRRGDRTRRAGDRQLLLDALCAARRSVFLSYRGRDEADDAERPPSAALGEVIDYLDLRFETADGHGGGHALVRHHPLQPFSERYFADDPRLFGYSDALARASGEARAGLRARAPLFAAPLDPEAPGSEPVSPADLVAFWSAPARALVGSRLRIRLEEWSHGDDLDEPFTIAGLDRYRLRERLLERRQSGCSEGADLERLRAEGRLPHGPAGASVLDRERVVVADFLARLNAERADMGDEAPLEVDLEIDGVRIAGALGSIGSAGLLASRLGGLRARDRVALWIRHLLLCIAAPPGIARRSRWIHAGGTFELAAVDDPHARVAELLHMRSRGLREPLPFFPEASLAFAHAAASSRAGDPLVAARRAWDGAPEVPGEGEDPWIRFAWRGADPLATPGFAELATRIAGPLDAAS